MICPELLVNGSLEKVKLLECSALPIPVDAEE